MPVIAAPAVAGRISAAAATVAKGPGLIAEGIAGGVRTYALVKHIEGSPQLAIHYLFFVSIRLPYPNSSLISMWEADLVCPSL